jgi:hypothetical protein
MLRTCLSKPAGAGMALIALLLASGPGPVRAQPIDRVEEDWELVVSMPAYGDEGPQITTVMAPARSGRPGTAAPRSRRCRP